MRLHSQLAVNDCAVEFCVMYIIIHMSPVAHNSGNSLLHDVE